MSHLTPGSSGSSGDLPNEDAALVELVRDGNEAAFALLYERHEPMVRRIARSISNPSDVDDVVSEAFARTLAALRTGTGPTQSFAGYLSTTVRRTWIDRMRRTSRYISVDASDLETALVDEDQSERIVKAVTFREAFVSLQPRWQRVLWLCEVEQVSHTDVGELMDMTPNAVAALAFRARRALQDAYLEQHVSTGGSPDCTNVRAMLPGHVNGRASAGEARAIEGHLGTCAACRICLADLHEARVNLGVLLLPAAAASWGLDSLAGAAATLGGAPATVGWAGVLTAKTTALVAGALSAAAVGTAIILTPVGADPTVTTAQDQVRTAKLVSRHAPTTTSTPRTAAPAERLAPPTRTPRIPVVTAPSPEPSPELTEATDPPSPEAPRTTEPVAPPTTDPTPTPPSPTPSPTPEPSPTPTPTPEPTTEPEPPSNPRITSVDESDSPRGGAWRRLTISVADATDGDAIEMTASGGAGYCAGLCVTAEPEDRWTVRWFGPGSERTVSADVLPSQPVAVTITLTTSTDDDDPSDNTVTRTITKPIS